MRILLCHNSYLEPGGEDRVFADECRLLESRGHEVVRYTVHSRAIDSMGKASLARKVLWNRDTYAEIRRLIAAARPDVLHCTNTFPLISPAVYDAACREGVPVVQSLHNYRLLCPNALLYRNGRACEDCLGQAVPWPGVFHACYRKSRAASAGVAAMLALSRARRTWSRRVDRYLAVSDFARRKFVEGGLPAERITVKPNFVDPDPGAAAGGGGYALFAGRLAPEKGIETLLAAWERSRTTPIEDSGGAPQLPPLVIAGDGPLADQVRAACCRDARITWLGRRPPHEVLDWMGGAACVVIPSRCYENFPRALVEAWAKGTPAVVSRLGALAELVEEGRTGLCFEPGEPRDLAAAVARLLADPARLAEMRRAARREYEAKYTSAANYRVLMEVYAEVTGAGGNGRAIAGPLGSRPEKLCSMSKGNGNGARIGRPGNGRIASVVPVASASRASESRVVWPRKVELFGVGVSVATYEEVEEAVLAAAGRGAPAIVSCHAVHAVVTASLDGALRERVNSFEILAADGQPVRWAMNLLHGTKLTDRVYGPELMLRLCGRAAAARIPVFLCGGREEVVARLRDSLCARYGGLEIAGVDSPPFRPLTRDEDDALVERIGRSKARIVFVGLGCPKQDYFAYEHRDRIRAVQVCVGAAFDLHAGMRSMAPAWMQRNGLEWLFRLSQEPRRLAARYLLTNPLFLAQMAAKFVDGQIRRTRGVPGRHARETVPRATVPPPEPDRRDVKASIVPRRSAGGNGRTPRGRIASVSESFLHKDSDLP
jgi:exopolysaccharide biosynthesis WecB/TagA/CpsF family protein